MTRTAVLQRALSLWSPPRPGLVNEVVLKQEVSFVHQNAHLRKIYNTANYDGEHPHHDLQRDTLFLGTMPGRHSDGPQSQAYI